MHRLQQPRGLATTAFEAAFRAEAPKVLASLARFLGRLDLAEEAVQDAFVVALERWPRDGLPARPGAWITTTARNKAMDRLRRETKRPELQAEAHRSLAALDGWNDPPDSVVRDDLLRLVFTCCHPALPEDARVALALRTLCGLSTGEIARLFLVPEPTMAQRLVRAKRRITELALPYRIPAAHELPERLPAVLATVHLLFTEGHAASSGDAHVRPELCDEAVRLARLLVDLMPDEAEVVALLALLALTDARRAARVDDEGRLIRMADQDRTLWDRELIAEGAELAERALRMGPVGPYQLEAAISACHAEAPSYGETDWTEIAALYEVLEQLDPGPVTRLNRSVAVAETDGPEAALELLATIGDLDDSHLRWAVQADLLRRVCRTSEAAAAYRRALSCKPNEVERRFLEEELERLL